MVNERKELVKIYDIITEGSDFSYIKKYLNSEVSDYDNLLLDLIKSDLMLFEHPIYKENIRKTIKFLIDEKNININVQDIRGETLLGLLLQRASRGANDNTDIIEMFIEADIDINAKNNSSETAWSFVHTIVNPTVPLNLKTLKVLIKAGADINAIDERSYRPTALISLCALVSTEAVKILLENGADVHYKDKEGKDALHIICEYLKVSDDKTDKKVNEIIELLIQHGADVNTVDKHLKSPLMKLIGNKYALCTKTLVENKANPYLVDDVGMNILHYLCLNVSGKQTEEKTLNVIKKHIPQKVIAKCINKKDTVLGETPLLKCAKNSHIETMNFLTDNGADVHIQNNSGDTAIWKLLISHTDVYEKANLLLDLKADPMVGFIKDPEKGIYIVDAIKYVLSPEQESLLDKKAKQVMNEIKLENDIAKMSKEEGFAFSY